MCPCCGQHQATCLEVAESGSQELLSQDSVKRQAHTAPGPLHRCAQAPTCCPCRAHSHSGWREEHLGGHAHRVALDVSLSFWLSCQGTRWLCPCRLRGERLPVDSPASGTSLLLSLRCFLGAGTSLNSYSRHLLFIRKFLFAGVSCLKGDFTGDGTNSPEPLWRPTPPPPQGHLAAPSHLPSHQAPPVCIFGLQPFRCDTCR